MKDEFKIGDIVIGVYDKKDYKIEYIGKEVVCFSCGGYAPIEALGRGYTLKKPEPTLKKLVAWVDNFGKIWVDHENAFTDTAWTKKELIVKDGSLYVDMSEVVE